MSPPVSVKTLLDLHLQKKRLQQELIGQLAHVPWKALLPLTGGMIGLAITAKMRHRRITEQTLKDIDRTLKKVAENTEAG